MENARKQITVPRWLAEIDYPATRAVAVDKPVETDGRGTQHRRCCSAPPGSAAGSTRPRAGVLLPATWLQEDDDVWGADSGTPPA